MLEQLQDEKLLIKLKKCEKFADAYFADALQRCNNMPKEEAKKELMSVLKLITQARGGWGNTLEKFGLADYFYAVSAFILLKIWR